MKRCIDKMLVILPFEKEYYKNKWNWEVEYVGHPLVEVVEAAQQNSSLALNNSHTETGALSKKIIALLPGSRKQEIIKKLPVMLEASQSFPDYRFVVAKAPGQEDGFYDNMLAPYRNVYSVSNQTYALLKQSTAALVTSGTATLETALFGVPEVVCYKGSAVSYQIARRIISIKYISLVNLIMDKPVVKELIQDEMNVENIKKELTLLLTDTDRIQQVKADYSDLKNLLSLGGHASANAAESILAYLRHAS